MTAFLSLDDTLEIHRQIIQATGGAPGVRDVGLLDSALHRPQASFGGVAFYPTLAEQAAALLHSLATNHPFVDGNKRVAFTAMDVFLRLNDRTLQASEDEAYALVVAVATNSLPFPDVVRWIAEHVGAS